jgi:hypothetical protein
MFEGMWGNVEEFEKKMLGDMNGECLWYNGRILRVLMF